MENKNELAAAAKRELAKRREAALLGAEARKAALYGQLPRLIELDNQIINAGITAARLAAAGAPPQTVSEAMARTGQAEAARYRLIEESGFDKHYLQPQFFCPKCRDTGRADGLLCECYTELIKKLRREAINRDFPLALSRFDSFSLERYSAQPQPELGASPREIMREVLAYCQSYAEAFDTRCKSLFMMGDAGLGKTHLALSIAGSALDKGFDVVYVSAQDAFSRIEKENFGGNGSALLPAMLEADLLIVDDLGTEFITPFVLSTLYQLVNTRMGRHLPTIYTTNIITQQLLVTRYTEKVASRLLGSCEILQFFGRDLRLTEK